MKNDFFNLYSHGFARVAACTVPITVADAETITSVEAGVKADLFDAGEIDEAALDVGPDQVVEALLATEVVVERPEGGVGVGDDGGLAPQEREHGAQPGRGIHALEHPLPVGRVAAQRVLPDSARGQQQIQVRTGQPARHSGAVAMP